MNLAPTRALRDLGALVFGDDRQDLAQQHALGRSVVGLLDAHDRGTGAGELFLQQDLMSEVAAQPVDRPHQHCLDLTARNAVTQRFERRALEGCAAEAVIGKHARVGDRPAAPAGMVQNPLTLTERSSRVGAEPDSTLASTPPPSPADMTSVFVPSLRILLVDQDRSGTRAS